MTEPTGRGSGQPHQPGLAWQRWLRCRGADRADAAGRPVARHAVPRPAAGWAPPQDEQAREAIEFGLRLGDLLLRSGSGTRDVEAA